MVNYTRFKQMIDFTDVNSITAVGDNVIDDKDLIFALHRQSRFILK